MRKPDEIAFYAELRVVHQGAYKNGQCWVPFADAIGEQLGMHEKRVYSLLNKWTDRDWWEFGVSMRSGWFTESAPEALTP